MKRLIVALILCSMVLIAFAGCSENTKKENDNLFEKAQNQEFFYDTELDDNYKENSEIVDVIEKTIIPEAKVTEVVYSEAIPYYDNRIVVSQAGKYGIIDNLGNVVLPITQTKRIVPLNLNCVRYEENDKYGVLSVNGDRILPAEYDNIRVINDDLLYLENYFYAYEDVTLYQYDLKTVAQIYSIEKRDFIDIKITGDQKSTTVAGNLICIHYVTYDSDEDQICCNVIYDYDGNLLYSFEDEDWFGEYYCLYITSENSVYIVFKNRVLDSSGKVVYELYDEEKHFLFGRPYETYYGEKLTVKEISSGDEYGNYYNFYSFDLATGETTLVKKLDEKIYTIEKLENGFYKIGVLTEGTNHFYYGVLNNDFDMIVEPIYNSIGDYVNGYFPVELGKYWGFVDEKGNKVQPIFADDDLKDSKFSYWNEINNGALINPKDGETLPYTKAKHIDGNGIMVRTNGIFEAVLIDEESGEQYKSFVTWDGPIINYKFPNTKIKLSNDEAIAVYNNGAVYTIVEFP